MSVAVTAFSRSGSPRVTIGDGYRSTLGGPTADQRLEPEKHFTVSQAGFDAYDPGPRRFDPITFVASLHRMDLRSSLERHATS